MTERERQVWKGEWTMYLGKLEEFQEEVYQRVGEQADTWSTPWEQGLCEWATFCPGVRKAKVYEGRHSRLMLFSEHRNLKPISFRLRRT